MEKSKKIQGICESTKIMKEIAITFDRALVRMILVNPAEVGLLYSGKEDFPRVKELEKAMRECLILQRKCPEQFSLVSSTLYALNLIPQTEGYILYRKYFFKREEDSWKDVFSPSGYYKVLNKGIKDFLEILDDEKVTIQPPLDNNK